MGVDLVEALWGCFNRAVQPAHDAGKLGVVLFQFHNSFGPTAANIEHVLWCREHLDARFPMAVEFRNRGWIGTEKVEATLAMCKKHSLTLVASDDLKHEQEQSDRRQTGLPPGERAVKLPTLLRVTAPHSLYVRIHRRQGTNRLLDKEEIQDWKRKLLCVSEEARACGAPIYFLWGTDHEDQPVRNAAHLDEACPDLQSCWAAHVKNQSRGTFMRSFSAVRSPSREAQGEGSQRSAAGLALLEQEQAAVAPGQPPPSERGEPLVTLATKRAIGEAGGCADAPGHPPVKRRPLGSFFRPR